METAAYKIFPLGTDALTVEFGNEISIALNDKAVNLSKYFEENPFEGFIETVPAYASVTLFYDVFKVRKFFPEFPTAFDAIRHLIENALQNSSETTRSKPRLIKIPVDFSPGFALDLRYVFSDQP